MRATSPAMAAVSSGIQVFATHNRTVAVKPLAVGFSENSATTPWLGKTPHGGPTWARIGHDQAL